MPLPDLQGAASPDLQEVTSCAVPVDLGSAIGHGIASGDSRTATDHGRHCNNGFVGEPDVAFTWTAPAAGTYVFDTLGADYEVMLQIFDGVCNGPTLGCADRAFDPGSRVQVTLAAGQVIVIVLDGFADAGNYVLNAWPYAAEICDDGIDNDHDNLVDCDDHTDCDAFRACNLKFCLPAVCTSQEYCYYCGGVNKCIPLDSVCD